MPYKYPSLRTTLPVAGYYARLDSGAAASDQFTADGAQNGTLTNGATRVDDGGLAYSFDGVNDFISINDANLFTFSTVLTLSAWVYLTSSQTGYRALVTKSNSTVFEWGLFLNAGRPEGIVFQSDGNRVARFKNTVLDTGAWVHLAIVVSGSSPFTASMIKVYVNGVLSDDSNDNTQASVMLTNTISPIGIGSNPIGNNAFNGLIDDVLVWSSAALSATDIGYLASQRGAIYQILAGSSPINGQSLIRPAGDYSPQQLIVS